MQTLVEDFLQHLRHERGQAEHTQRTYAALLNRFVAWAGDTGLSDWKEMELKHLMAFLQHERQRELMNGPGGTKSVLEGEQCKAPPSPRTPGPPSQSPKSKAEVAKRL